MQKVSSTKKTPDYFPKYYFSLSENHTNVLRIGKIMSFKFPMNSFAVCKMDGVKKQGQVQVRFDDHTLLFKITTISGNCFYTLRFVGKDSNYPFFKISSSKE